MPYIDLRDQKEGLVMIETVRKNMGDHTPEKIKGAKLARVAQGRVGHPPDRVLKQMVSDNIPKICPLVLTTSLIPLSFMVPLYPG